MGEMISLAAAVLVHEAGHLAAARLLRIPLRKGRGGFFGVRLSFDFSRCGYGREALVHLAGPLCGIAAAVLSASVCAAGGTGDLPGRDPALRFAGMNLALSLLNLLPLPGFDGGGALLCLLRMLPEEKDGERAERTAFLAGWAARLLLWLLAARCALTEKPDVGLLLFAAGEIAGARNGR